MVRILRVLFLAAAIACIGALRLASLATEANEKPRQFSAMLANGERIAGQSLTHWNQGDSFFRLDEHELMNADDPLVWLRDHHLQAGALPTAYLETTTGDRLPCEVISFEPGDVTNWQSLPPHFIVRPTINVSTSVRAANQHVRVLANFVRCIVRGPRFSRTTCSPEMLITRQGRTVKFQTIRFVGQNVRLLTDEGQLTFALSDIAHLQMPAADSWEASIDELAVVSPQGEDRLVQFDTIDGAVLTASTARLRLLSQGESNNFDHCWLALQPAWSLDLLWVNTSRIWQYRSWAFHQMPLSRISPVSVVSKSLIGSGPYAWQRDRNFDGQPLQANSQAHGWGFGVHAHSELHFALPTMANGFRTRMCLDDSIGTGGCVIARIIVGATDKRLLFESPHLVGSNHLQDSGSLDLADLDADQRILILQVDAAAQNRPANSDPLDIRDVFDWLDPVVSLDVAKLRDAVGRRALNSMPPFADWQVVEHSDGDYVRQSVWEDLDQPQPGRFISSLRVSKQPLIISRELTIESKHRWLVLSAYRQGESSDESEIEIRIDGDTVARTSVPHRDGQIVPRPLLVPLSTYLGRTIRLEVVSQPPSNVNLSPVQWQALKIVELPPTLSRVLDVHGNENERPLKVSLGNNHRFEFEQPIAIRGMPNLAQKRLLRFAFRKRGRGSVTVELEHAKSNSRPAIYSAGIPLFDAARSREVVWIDDTLPPVASPQGSEGANSWHWIDKEEGPVFSGLLAVRRTAASMGQQVAAIRANEFQLNDGDRLFAYAFVDPRNPPRQLMLQATADGSNWEHRAYWGESVLSWGTEGSPSRRKLGKLPPGGEWVRLEVPIHEIGLSSQTSIRGLALTQFGGNVTWDKIGVQTTRDEHFRPSTRTINAELSDGWTVVTRDAFADFGELDVTALVLRVPDGEQADFDSIYFFHSEEDLEHTRQVGALRTND